MKTLEWVKSQELPTGGLAAWPGMKAYPEVTGYMIPTLLAYGETVLAERCGDWLEGTQNQDGSWNGLDAMPAAFDTAAILEGLWALGRVNAAAENYLRRTMIDNGALPAGEHPPKAYMMRVTAILEDEIATQWWSERLHSFTDERSHYIAYALEGLWRMGRHDMVCDWLKMAPCPVPWQWDGGGSVDYCATAQFGLLKAWAGMDYHPHLDYLRAAQRMDGAFPMPFLWTAKYYLDLEKFVE
jgi:hypothetical protein